VRTHEIKQTTGSIVYLQFYFRRPHIPETEKMKTVSRLCWKKCEWGWNSFSVLFQFYFTMCDGLKIVTSKLHSGCLYVRGDSLLLRSTQQLTLTLAMSYKPSFFMLQHFPLWGPFPRGNHSS